MNLDILGGALAHVDQKGGSLHNRLNIWNISKQNDQRSGPRVLTSVATSPSFLCWLTAFTAKSMNHHMVHGPKTQESRISTWSCFVSVSQQMCKHNWPLSSFNTRHDNFQRRTLKEIPAGHLAVVDNGHKSKYPAVSKQNPLNSIKVRKFKGRVWSQQEWFNGCLKNFGCLWQQFCHDKAKHKMCSEAAAVICQHQLENELPLFDVWLTQWSDWHSKATYVCVFWNNNSCLQPMELIKAPVNVWNYQTFLALLICVC